MVNKKVVLGMKEFYQTVIKDLQEQLPFSDTLLKVLTYLSPKEQQSTNSLQHCRLVANEMPSVDNNQLSTGDE